MRYFEDFTLGEVVELGSRSVSREEIIDFARQFDPQYFHVDEERAKESIYGGLIASGWHTAALTMRLAADGLILDSASMGSPGVDELRWLKPVRPGDTLSARFTVTEIRPSGSKPDRGIVKSFVEVANQDGETVLTWKAMGMYRRRTAA
ncbi:MAG: MaoC family dehydratase [Alphaproteobacteria bacterium]